LLQRQLWLSHLHPVPTGTPPLLLLLLLSPCWCCRGGSSSGGIEQRV
jgi:hypothetical protein